MKIDIENRFLIKIMTFIPPLLGILVFSYVVKFSGNSFVGERLPMYQGISAYFSLILIGFTYIKNRQNILGQKMLFSLFGIIMLPIVFYSFLQMNILVSVCFTLMSFFSVATLYLLLVKKQIFYYLLFSIISSALLPCGMLIKPIFLPILVVGMMVLFLWVVKNVFPLLSEFGFKDGGVDIVSSIFFHSPFILLPFFDFMVQTIIGEQSYKDYVFVNKYINGGITLLFSYKQLNLIFSDELKDKMKIMRILLSILLVSVVLVFVKNIMISVLLMALCSLGINLSSLIVRSRLIQGSVFVLSLWGIFFTILYVLSLYIFRDYIAENKHFFILLMIICSIFPSFVVFNSKRINGKKGYSL